jgi:hypothetical protein
MALNDDLGKLKDELEELDNSLRGIAANLKTNLTDEIKNMDGAVKKTAQSFEKDLANSINKSNSSLDIQNGLILKIQKGENVTKNIQKELEKVQRERAVSLRKVSNLKKEGVYLDEEDLYLLEETYKKQEEELIKLQKINDEKQKNKSFTQIIKENVGSIANKLDKTGTLSKILSGNLKDTLTSTRLGELALLGILKAFLEIDTASGEMAKFMGISYNEAKDLRSELTQVSSQSESIFVNTKNMQESMMALNKEFGTATSFSSGMLEDFTRLTKEAGYSAEAAGSLAKITVLTGTDLSDNVETILGQAQAYNAVNKVSINTKQLTEDVAKTSAATTLTLGKNPKLIASANIAARALGTSLEKVESIASSLLNFEQSISNELEAELMIGKELNLEVAREAALRGEVGKVAEEVAKQVGTSAEFGAMNVLQQEALAKAVGMTREDLAKSLMEREALVKLGTQDKDLQSSYNTLKKQGLSDDEIAKRLGDDKLANQLKSTSVQERLTESINKMKEIFLELAPIISPIFEGFANLVGSISKSKMAMEGLKVIMATLAAKSLVTAIASIFGGMAFLGPIGLGIATAAVAGLMLHLSSAESAAKKIGDGAFGADGSIQISTKEGGLFEPSPNDDVVIFPGAIDKMNQPNPTSPTGNVDQSQLIAEVRKQNDILMRILQKDTNIEIDGTILNKKVQQSLSPLG